MKKIVLSLIALAGCVALASCAKSSCDKGKCDTLPKEDCGCDSGCGCRNKQ